MYVWSAAVKLNSSSPVLNASSFTWSDLSSIVTVSSVRKWYGHWSRVRWSSVSTSLTDEGSSEEPSFSGISHSVFLAKPCCGNGPVFANCGHTTGIPPRMGSPGAKVAVFPMNSTSLPPAGIHDVTCAPFRYTSAELPEGCESSTVDIPFLPGTMGGVMGSDIEGRGPDSASRSHRTATGSAVPEVVRS